MPEPLLEVRGLSKAFGAITVSDNIDLSIITGETHAIIGPNGAGKTTLIGQLTGEIAPDRGTVLFEGYPITMLPTAARSRRGIARSFQITSLFSRFTALENVALSVQARQGHSFRFWSAAAEDTSLTEPAKNALEQVGLKERADCPAAALAHGEQRQLEIAMALACAPKLLVLDEPAAGMGREDTLKLVELLKGLKRQVTILLIEHDMDAVFALADRITVLVYGRIITSGPPVAIREDPMVREAYLGQDQGAA